MFDKLEAILLETTNILPLELFVFFGSIIEEIVAPIPSPTVMVVAGSIALIEGRGMIALLPLALIGALGKTIGALAVYTIVDKSEDFFMSKFGRFFHITHDDIEKLGAKLGKGYKDYVLLIVLRALPVVPSVVISVGSGLLKVGLTLFIVTTFVGTIIKDGFYLYAGYVGTDVFTNLVAKTTHFETYVEILIVAGVIFGIVRFMRRKKVIPVEVHKE